MSDQSQTTDATREEHYRKLDKIQRQTTRRYILLPAMALFIILFLIVTIMLSLRTPAQVAIVSDFMLTVFVICPIILCLFPIVLLMSLLIGWMGQLHSGAQSPLRRLESWSHRMEHRVESLTGMVDNRVVNWAVRFAPLRRILTIFDEPLEQNVQEDQTNGKQTGTDQ